MDPNFLNTTRQKMGKALELLRNDLSTVRTGRAAPSLVENITINSYGGTQKLRVMELATIAAIDNQTLVLTPFDETIIGEIQKGIIAANVGLTPMIDGALIRISIPPLSQERREELIKMMQQKLENCRIMIRQNRQEAMSVAKKLFADKAISEDDLTRSEKEIQRLTDEQISEIDGMGKKKEAELMQL